MKSMFAVWICLLALLPGYVAAQQEEDELTRAVVRTQEIRRILTGG